MVETAKVVATLHSVITGELQRILKSDGCRRQWPERDKSIIINREAAGGWKYIAMETIETQETKGCIKKEVEVNYIYMLIFGKEN